MELQWMGRYRDIVRELIYYSNFSNRTPGKKMNEAEPGLSLGKHEYQVLEYVIEFSQENRIQADISRDLGVLPSVVTNAVRTLLRHKLVERYHIQGNRKSIVLRPTPKGCSVYEVYRSRDIEKLFLPFFAALEGVPDGQRRQMTQAIHRLNTGWSELTDNLLQKIND